MVEEVVPGSTVRYGEHAEPDRRCYRVDCGKLARTLPEFAPAWTVRRGIEELYAAYRRYGLTRDEFLGPSYHRVGRILELQRQGLLDGALRWQPVGAPAPEPEGPLRRVAGS
jgi:hypothetical protein